MFAKRPDAGDILKEFFEEHLEKAKAIERKTEIQVLNAKRDSILREKAELQRRLLEEDWIDDKLLRKFPDVDEMEIKEQAMAYQIVHGISMKSNGDRSTYFFSPKTRPGGTVLGPFEVTLQTLRDGGVRIYSYVLPRVADADFNPRKRVFKSSDPQNYLTKKTENKDNVIDIDQLERLYLAKENANVGHFVQVCSGRLCAYVYRMNQVTEMLDKYQEELEDVQYSYNITKIKFILKLETMGDDEEASGNVFKISMKLDYEVDKIRPTPSSLVVRFVSGSENMDEEMMRTFLDQCQSFYDEDLAQAIDIAFR